MSGAWVVDDGMPIYLTDGGDGVELDEVFDHRTPLSLRLAAASSLVRAIEAVARIEALEAERDELRVEVERLSSATEQVGWLGTEWDAAGWLDEGDVPEDGYVEIASEGDRWQYPAGEWSLAHEDDENRLVKPIAVYVIAADLAAYTAVPPSTPVTQEGHDHA